MNASVQLHDVVAWYNDRGSGAPVVLAHGGFTDSRDFEGNLARLAESFRVLMPDRRGHGRTPDAPGPITITRMADDHIAFCEEVVGGPVAMVGYSAGAAVSLAAAARRPDLVTSLVLISGFFDPQQLLIKPQASGSWPSEIVDAYGEVSPDGVDHFPIVADKVITGSQSPGLDPSSLDVIRCPVLVTAADDDLVTLEHTIALYRLFRDGYLCVVPGASHLLLHENPDELTDLVEKFLHGPPGPRMMPISR